jgi:hypothetical protein
MVLIQLLLPTSGTADGDDLAPLAETRRELSDRFNGLTAYLRSLAKGWWTTPDGHTEQDHVVMVEVVTETFDRAWWRTYAASLAARFARAATDRDRAERERRAIRAARLSTEARLQDGEAAMTPRRSGARIPWT